MSPVAKLRTGGAPVAIESHRYVYGRDACKIRANGEDIVEIHCERIAYFFAKRESGCRRCRSEQCIAHLECVLKILRDEPPDALA